MQDVSSTTWSFQFSFFLINQNESKEVFLGCTSFHPRVCIHKSYNLLVQILVFLLKAITPTNNFSSSFGRSNPFIFNQRTNSPSCQHDQILFIFNQQRNFPPPQCNQILFFFRPTNNFLSALVRKKSYFVLFIFDQRTTFFLP